MEDYVMKKYARPELDVLEFELIDIIRTSGDENENKPEGDGYEYEDDELPVRPRNYWN